MKNVCYFNILIISHLCVSFTAVCLVANVMYSFSKQF